MQIVETKGNWVQRICVFLTGVILTNTALAYNPETNIWKERRAQVSQAQQQYAQLPAQALKTLPPLPKYSNAAALSAQVSGGLSPSQLEALSPLVKAMPASYGNVRQIFPSKNPDSKILIHIQDIHLNSEAQSNISKTVKNLIDEGRVDVVALEGQSHEIALQGFREFPYQDIVRQVADALLLENGISGPVHAALSATKKSTIIGIDDESHYLANIEAYKQSSAQSKKAKRQLETAQAELEKHKSKIFGANLKALDQKVEAYRADQMAMGPYLSFLASLIKDDLSFNGQIFLEAVKMESSLDFKRVETERASLIAAFVKKLDKAKTDELLAMSVAYRSGQVRHTDFYKYIRHLCETTGVSLSQYKAMDSYIQYVLLADSIDAEKLFADVRGAEEKAYGALVQTPEQKKLVQDSRHLYLAKKLVDFALTKEEWEEYRGVRGPHYAPRTTDLNAFEKFYEEAEIRDQAMSDNVLKAMNRHNAKVAVLVTGGFHSAGMSKKFNQAGFTTISFVPKITSVADASGSSYLGVFAQEKTPLTQLFEGQKLFLADRPDKTLFQKGVGMLLGGTALFLKSVATIPTLYNQYFPIMASRFKLAVDLIGEHKAVVKISEGLKAARLIVQQINDRLVGEEDISMMANGTLAVRNFFDRIPFLNFSNDVNPFAIRPQGSVERTSEPKQQREPFKFPKLSSYRPSFGFQVALGGLALVAIYLSSPIAAYYLSAIAEGLIIGKAALLAKLAAAGIGAPVFILTFTAGVMMNALVPLNFMVRGLMKTKAGQNVVDHLQAGYEIAEGKFPRLSHVVVDLLKTFYNFGFKASDEYIQIMLGDTAKLDEHSYLQKKFQNYSLPLQIITLPFYSTFSILKRRLSLFVLSTLTHVLIASVFGLHDINYLEMLWGTKWFAEAMGGNQVKASVIRLMSPTGALNSWVLSHFLLGTLRFKDARKYESASYLRAVGEFFLVFSPIAFRKEDGVRKWGANRIPVYNKVGKVVQTRWVYTASFDSAFNLFKGGLFYVDAEISTMVWASHANQYLHNIVIKIEGSGEHQSVLSSGNHFLNEVLRPFGMRSELIVTDLFTPKEEKTRVVQHEPRNEKTTISKSNLERVKNPEPVQPVNPWMKGYDLIKTAFKTSEQWGKLPNQVLNPALFQNAYEDWIHGKLAPVSPDWRYAGGRTLDKFEWEGDNGVTVNVFGTKETRPEANGFEADVRSLENLMSVSFDPTYNGVARVESVQKDFRSTVREHIPSLKKVRDYALKDRIKTTEFTAFGDNPTNGMGPEVANPGKAERENKDVQVWLKRVQADGETPELDENGEEIWDRIIFGRNAADELIESSHADTNGRINMLEMFNNLDRHYAGLAQKDSFHQIKKVDYFESTDFRLLDRKLLTINTEMGPRARGLISQQDVDNNPPAAGKIKSKEGVDSWPFLQIAKDQFIPLRLITRYEGGSIVFSRDLAEIQRIINFENPADPLQLIRDYMEKVSKRPVSDQNVKALYKYLLKLKEKGEDIKADKIVVDMKDGQLLSPDEAAKMDPEDLDEIYYGNLAFDKEIASKLYTWVNFKVNMDNARKNRDVLAMSIPVEIAAVILNAKAVTHGSGIDRAAFLFLQLVTNRLPGRLTDKVFMEQSLRILSTAAAKEAAERAQYALYEIDDAPDARKIEVAHDQLVGQLDHEPTDEEVKGYLEYAKLPYEDRIVASYLEDFLQKKYGTIDRDLYGKVLSLALSDPALKEIKRNSTGQAIQAWVLYLAQVANVTVLLHDEVLYQQALSKVQKNTYGYVYVPKVGMIPFYKPINSDDIKALENFKGLGNQNWNFSGDISISGFLKNAGVDMSPFGLTLNVLNPLLDMMRGDPRAGSDLTGTENGIVRGSYLRWDVYGFAPSLFERLREAQTYLKSMTRPGVNAVAIKPANPIKNFIGIQGAKMWDLTERERKACQLEPMGRVMNKDTKELAPMISYKIVKAPVDVFGEKRSKELEGAILVMANDAMEKGFYEPYRAKIDFNDLVMQLEGGGASYRIVGGLEKLAQQIDEAVVDVEKARAEQVRTRTAVHGGKAGQAMLDIYRWWNPQKKAQEKVTAAVMKLERLKNDWRIRTSRQQMKGANEYNKWQKIYDELLASPDHKETKDYVLIEKADLITGRFIVQEKDKDGNLGLIKEIELVASVNQLKEKEDLRQEQKARLEQYIDLRQHHGVIALNMDGSFKRFEIGRDKLDALLDYVDSLDYLEAKAIADDNYRLIRNGEKLIGNFAPEEKVVLPPKVNRTNGELETRTFEKGRLTVVQQKNKITFNHYERHGIKTHSETYAIDPNGPVELPGNLRGRLLYTTQTKEVVFPPKANGQLDKSGIKYKEVKTYADTGVQEELVSGQFPQPDEIDMGDRIIKNNYKDRLGDYDKKGRIRSTDLIDKQTNKTISSSTIEYDDISHTSIEVIRYFNESGRVIVTEEKVWQEPTEKESGRRLLSLDRKTEGHQRHEQYSEYLLHPATGEMLAHHVEISIDGKPAEVRDVEGIDAATGEVTSKIQNLRSNKITREKINRNGFMLWREQQSAEDSRVREKIIYDVERQQELFKQTHRFIEIPKRAEDLSGNTIGTFVVKADVQNGHVETLDVVRQKEQNWKREVYKRAPLNHANDNLEDSPLRLITRSAGTVSNDGEQVVEEERIYYQDDVNISADLEKLLRERGRSRGDGTSELGRVVALRNEQNQLATVGVSARIMNGADLISAAGEQLEQLQGAVASDSVSFGYDKQGNQYIRSHQIEFYRDGELVGKLDEIRQVFSLKREESAINNLAATPGRGKKGWDDFRIEGNKIGVLRQYSVEEDPAHLVPNMPGSLSGATKAFHIYKKNPAGDNFIWKSSSLLNARGAELAIIEQDSLMFGGERVIHINTFNNQTSEIFGRADKRSTYKFIVRNSIDGTPDQGDVGTTLLGEAIRMESSDVIDSNVDSSRTALIAKLKNITRPGVDVFKISDVRLGRTWFAFFDAEHENQFIARISGKQGDKTRIDPKTKKPDPEPDFYSLELPRYKRDVPVSEQSSISSLKPIQDLDVVDSVTYELIGKKIGNMTSRSHLTTIFNQQMVEKLQGELGREGFKPIADELDQTVAYDIESLFYPENASEIDNPKTIKTFTAFFHGHKQILKNDQQTQRLGIVFYDRQQPWNMRAGIDFDYRHVNEDPSQPLVLGEKLAFSLALPEEDGYFKNIVLDIGLNLPFIEYLSKQDGVRERIREGVFGDREDYKKHNNQEPSEEKLAEIARSRVQALLEHIKSAIDAGDQQSYASEWNNAIELFEVGKGLYLYAETNFKFQGFTDNLNIPGRVPSGKTYSPSYMRQQGISALASTTLLEKQNGRIIRARNFSGSQSDLVGLSMKPGPQGGIRSHSLRHGTAEYRDDESGFLNKLVTDRIEVTDQNGLKVEMTLGFVSGGNTLQERLNNFSRSLVFRAFFGGKNAKHKVADDTFTTDVINGKEYPSQISAATKLLETGSVDYRTLRGISLKPVESVDAAGDEFERYYAIRNELGKIKFDGPFASFAERKINIGQLTMVAESSEIGPDGFISPDPSKLTWVTRLTYKQFSNISLYHEMVPQESDTFHPDEKRGLDVNLYGDRDHFAEMSDLRIESSPDDPRLHSILRYNHVRDRRQGFALVAKAFLTDGHAYYDEYKGIAGEPDFIRVYYSRRGLPLYAMGMDKEGKRQELWRRFESHVVKDGGNNYLAILEIDPARKSKNTGWVVFKNGLFLAKNQKWNFSTDEYRLAYNPKVKQESGFFLRFLRSDPLAEAVKIINRARTEDTIQIENFDQSKMDQTVSPRATRWISVNGMTVSILGLSLVIPSFIWFALAWFVRPINVNTAESEELSQVFAEGDVTRILERRLEKHYFKNLDEVRAFVTLTNFDKIKHKLRVQETLNQTLQERILSFVNRFMNDVHPVDQSVSQDDVELLLNKTSYEDLMSDPLLQPLAQLVENLTQRRMTPPGEGFDKFPIQFLTHKQVVSIIKEVLAQLKTLDNGTTIDLLRQKIWGTLLRRAFWKHIGREKEHASVMKKSAHIYFRYVLRKTYFDAGLDPDEFSNNVWIEERLKRWASSPTPEYVSYELSEQAYSDLNNGELLFVDQDGPWFMVSLRDYTLRKGVVPRYIGYFNVNPVLQEWFAKQITLIQEDRKHHSGVSIQEFMARHNRFWIQLLNNQLIHLENMRDPRVRGSAYKDENQRLWRFLTKWKDLSAAFLYMDGRNDTEVSGRLPQIVIERFGPQKFKKAQDDFRELLSRIGEGYYESPEFNNGALTDSQIRKIVETNIEGLVNGVRQAYKYKVINSERDYWSPFGIKFIRFDITKSRLIRFFSSIVLRDHKQFFHSPVFIFSMAAIAVVVSGEITLLISHSWFSTIVVTGSVFVIAYALHEKYWNPLHATLQRVRYLREWRASFFWVYLIFVTVVFTVFLGGWAFSHLDFMPIPYRIPFMVHLPWTTMFFFYGLSMIPMIIMFALTFTGLFNLYAVLVRLYVSYSHQYAKARFFDRERDLFKRKGALQLLPIVLKDEWNLKRLEKLIDRWYKEEFLISHQTAMRIQASIKELENASSKNHAERMNKLINSLREMETEDAQNSFKDWVNKYFRFDAPSEPRLLHTLRGTTFIVKGYGEDPYRSLVTVEDKPGMNTLDKNPGARGTQLGLIAQAYPARWKLMVAYMKEHGYLQGNNEEQLLSLSKNPMKELVLEDFSEAAYKFIEEFANSMLQSGVHNIVTARETARDTWELILRKIYSKPGMPKISDEEIQDLVDCRLQFAIDVERVGNLILNFLRARFLEDALAHLKNVLPAAVDQSAITEDERQAIEQKIGIAIKNKNRESMGEVMDYLATLPHRPNAPPISSFFSAKDLGRCFLSLNEYMALIKDGDITFPKQTSQTKLESYDNLAKFINLMSEKNILFLHGGRQGTSISNPGTIVHPAPAKYGQMIPSMLYSRENIFFLDWDMIHYLQEAFMYPNAMMSMYLSPKQLGGVYALRIFTAPISLFSRSNSTMEEGFTRGMLPVLNYVGSILNYGKFIRKAAIFENRGELLEDDMVAEDLMGAVRILARGVGRILYMGYITVGKGLGTHHWEMLPPWQKWSSDSGESTFNITSLEFYRSQFVHWTDKMTMLINMAFWLKKPWVKKVIALGLICFYHLDLNTWFGLPTALGAYNGLLVAEAIVFVAFIPKVEENAWRKGTAIYWRIMWTSLFMVATLMVVHYGTAVDVGVMLMTRFILTGFKGGALVRADARRIYIMSGEAVMRGVLMFGLIFFYSAWDPVKFSIWFLQIATVTVGWWWGPFLVNTSTSGRDFMSNIQDIFWAVPEALKDAANKLPEFFKSFAPYLGVFLISYNPTLAGIHTWIGLVLLFGDEIFNVIHFKREFNILGLRFRLWNLLSFTRMFGIDEKIFKRAVLLMDMYNMEQLKSLATAKLKKANTSLDHASFEKLKDETIKDLAEDRDALQRYVGEPSFKMGYDKKHVIADANDEPMIGGANGIWTALSTMMWPVRKVIKFKVKNDKGEDVEQEKRIFTGEIIPGKVTWLTPSWVQLKAVKDHTESLEKKLQKLGLDVPPSENDLKNPFYEEPSKLQKKIEASKINQMALLIFAFALLFTSIGYMGRSDFNVWMSVIGLSLATGVAINYWMTAIQSKNRNPFSEIKSDTDKKDKGDSSSRMGKAALYFLAAGLTLTMGCSSTGVNSSNDGVKDFLVKNWQVVISAVAMIFVGVGTYLALRRRTILEKEPESKIFFEETQPVQFTLMKEKVTVNAEELFLNDAEKSGKNAEFYRLFKGAKVRFVEIHPDDTVIANDIFLRLLLKVNEHEPGGEVIHTTAIDDRAGVTNGYVEAKGYGEAHTGLAEVEIRSIIRRDETKKYAKHVGLKADHLRNLDLHLADLDPQVYDEDVPEEIYQRVVENIHAHAVAEKDRSREVYVINYPFVGNKAGERHHHHYLVAKAYLIALANEALAENFSGTVVLNEIFELKNDFQKSHVPWNMVIGFDQPLMNLKKAGVQVYESQLQRVAENNRKLPKEENRLPYDEEIEKRNKSFADQERAINKKMSPQNKYAERFLVGKVARAPAGSRRLGPQLGQYAGNSVESIVSTLSGQPLSMDIKDPTGRLNQVLPVAERWMKNGYPTVTPDAQSLADELLKHDLDEVRTVVQRSLMSGAVGEPLDKILAQVNKPSSTETKVKTDMGNIFLLPYDLKPERVNSLVVAINLITDSTHSALILVRTQEQAKKFEGRFVDNPYVKVIADENGGVFKDSNIAGYSTVIGSHLSILTQRYEILKDRAALDLIYPLGVSIDPSDITDERLKTATPIPLDRLFMGLALEPQHLLDIDKLARILKRMA